MDVPTGWVQVPRGPRPPSQKWPMAQPLQRPRQPRVSPVSSGARAPSARPAARVSPDDNREAARSKDEKFQKALLVMGGTEGVAVECLGAELEKAKKAAQRPPLDIEVDACRKFIARSEMRIVELDRERELEQSALVENKARLHKLETEQTVLVEEAPLPQIGGLRWKLYKRR